MTQRAFALAGYVNVGFTNGYDFVANPLVTPPNTLNDVMRTSASPAVPNGTAVFLWDVATQSFGPPAIYSTSTGQWTPNHEVPVGRGFVVHSPGVWTNTFVGEVFEGTNLNLIRGSNKLSLVSGVLLMATNLAEIFSPADPFLHSTFPRVDGANVYTFQTASQSYSDAFTCFDGFGWHDPNGAVGTNGPTIGVAQSFFVRNPGPDTNWVTTVSFSMSAAPLAARAASASVPSAPQIIGIRLQAGTVILDLSPADATYNVEWSPDGFNWTVLAADQTGNDWSGPLPLGPQGYFRITQP